MWVPTWLLACHPPAPHTTPTVSEPPDLAIDRWSDQANRSGRWTAEIEVEVGVRAFQLTGTTDDGYAAIEELRDPWGRVVVRWQDWFYGDRSLTDAFFAYNRVVVFDWPIRPVDGELMTGTWTVVGDVIDAGYYYVPRANVDLTLATKRDPDLARSTVAVRILWAEGVGDDPDVVAAVEGAVVRWKEVWGVYGIDLVERYATSHLDPHMPWAWRGDDPSVEEASAGKLDDELQVVIGEQVRRDDYTYGVSGGIPGSIERTTATYVVVSWLVHAGIDGAFSEDEVRLMGETMAHEVGHYTGMYHPVESSYAAWDALDDTPECTRRRECEDALGDNLMFPYSICDATGCLVTDQLTSDQEGVMQRYVAALPP
ncbi:MAG: hypothetical protein H6738_06495 [Alphaproteobacteria bacterium]|nr:hypothetical protein [Alphaproteobacteria bacterium]MCB9696410.1 hypothetical protein [Alphaproteobacteria bacterium]